MNCLLDTGAIFANAYPRDSFHDVIRNFFRTPELRLFTTNTIVNESYTLLRRRAGWRVAMSSIEALQQAPSVTIMTLSESDEHQVYELLREFSGIPLSFADASLVCLGRVRRISTVAGFDEDLRLAGLTLVPNVPAP